MNIEKLEYLISHTDDKYKSRVKAVQWLSWRYNLKPNDFQAYIRMRWGDCRVVGDNAHGFGEPNWNPETFYEYIAKYLPGEEPLILEYDEKKKFIFQNVRRVYINNSKTEAESSNSQTSIIDNLDKNQFFHSETYDQNLNSNRGRKRKDRVAEDND